MDKSEPIKIKNIYRNPIGTFRPLLQSNQNRGEQETELHDGCQLGVASRGFCEIPKSCRRGAAFGEYFIPLYNEFR